ncbi:MAG: hypothetical protein ACI4ON_04830 [Clostridia bacterium]
MDKIYFLWLQKIACKNSKLNIRIYEEKILPYKELLIKEFNEEINYKEDLYRLNLDNSIINNFLDKNIKEEVKELYNKIKKYEFSIITIEDEEYPRKLLNIPTNPIFCYITNTKFNLNNKNVYVYFNDYFTKYARNLISYFAKIISEEKANLITEYEGRKIEKINIISEDMFKNIEKNKENCIIIPVNCYLDEFRVNLIDILVIIEAKYEIQIVNIVDKIIGMGKDIYVVPSNIYNKNSYFSNYLIKQGADIILNKWDLKFILKNIIC